MKDIHTSSFFLLPYPLSRAFTLVELIVVIGIIGILAGIMLTSFGGGRESARAAKCLSNMRNLAQGALSYASNVSSDGEAYYPNAGSYADYNPYVEKYYERKGWISWLSMNNPYKGGSTSFVKCETVGGCFKSTGMDEAGTFAITNGSLWKYVGRSRDIYVCPHHVIRAQKRGAQVRFSYVMNSYFGYDWSDGSDVGGGSKKRESVTRPDRILLFAELPFGEKGSDYDTANAIGDNAFSESTLTDCTLQYKANYNGKSYNDNWQGEAESIAFNHKSGKKWCAHVVFADGHAERLILPSGSGGLSATTLTALLCVGVDVIFDGSTYSVPKDGDDQASDDSNND